MRITFLVGSLEPGKDGVGDYARLLAGECARLGASCQLIAVADRHAARPLTAQLSSDVEMIRLPAQLSWRVRLDAAERASSWFAPQVVSLQFVPYSFQRWGVATKLIGALPRLCDAARLHVMCHEIWIGPEGSWRRRLISDSQRRSVLRLCRYPGTIVHSSIPFYQRMLQDHGVRARVLPLFGSVPVGQADALSWLGPRLAALGCDVSTSRHRWWLFAFFGALHAVWPPEPLLGRIEAAATAAGKRVALLSVGRIGPGEALWRDMQSRHGSRIVMTRLGEQPEQRISEVLNTADFGIATSPLALLGKSATAAAMFEHGLPVIVNREDVSWTWNDDSWDGLDTSLIIRLDARFAERLACVRRAEPRSRLASVAAAFMADLREPVGVGELEPGAAAGAARIDHWPMRSAAGDTGRATAANRV